MIPSFMVTSCDYFFKRQRARSLLAGCRRERLSFVTAERRPDAACLKMCPLALLLLLYLSAYRVWPLLANERTLVVSIFFGHESKLIDEDTY